MVSAITVAATPALAADEQPPTELEFFLFLANSMAEEDGLTTPLDIDSNTDEGEVPESNTGTPVTEGAWATPDSQREEKRQ